MKISFLGAGAWGSALARHLGQDGHRLTLWDYDTANLLEMVRTGRNDKYLPGIELPPLLHAEPDLAAAARGSDCIVVAAPSKGIKQVASVLGAFQGILVTVTKGIDYDTGLTMSGLLAKGAPHARIVALSGPTLALEVARQIPTAAVAASVNEAAAYAVQSLFHKPSFRVYTSSDIIGVELGGALKNVIAIGAGVCDGLGFGDNSKAALVTRAIVEIRRLGVACGAQPETFAGLSGLGDLVVTCFSKLSRNRMLGENLGRGIPLDQILCGTVSVAEGYPTAKSAWQLARTHGVSTPIIDQVYAMLHHGKPVAQAVQDLTARESKPEA